MANLLSQTAPLQHALRQEQLYLVLYLDQECVGARQNQNVVLNPSLAGDFGMFAVNDWPIYDGPDPSRANIVARARGHHIQASMDAAPQNWILSCNIVFMHDSRYGTHPFKYGSSVLSFCPWYLMIGFCTTLYIYNQAIRDPRL